MGAKIPQQSSPRYGAHPAVTTYDESYLKRRTKPGGLNPRFISAHIQLAGYDLTSNHIFKLLSGLLSADTFYEKYTTAKGTCQQKFPLRW